jgi:hypothetical protein
MTVKEILTQGANIKRIEQPLIISTGKSMTKAEARALGIQVDNIAKYIDLADTAIVFPLFTELNVAVCSLTLEVQVVSDAQPPVYAAESVTIDITSVLVDAVLSEIKLGLQAFTEAEVICSYRGNRLHFVAQTKSGQVGILNLIDELRVLDSRGNPNTQSVNDLSNPARMFTYFYPDNRAISKVGDVEYAPPREDFVTTQSIGVSQGEPRTSESLNRHLEFSARQLSDLNATADRLLIETRKVKIPLEITTDSFELTVDYSASEPPAAIWHSWNGPAVQDPGPGPIPGTTKFPRPGGLQAAETNNMTLLYLRGISPSTLSGYGVKIVNEQGEHRGLISPDNIVRGNVTAYSEYDRGVKFPENIEWRVINNDLTYAYSQDLIDLIDQGFIADFVPLSNSFGRQATVGGDELIDINALPTLGGEIIDGEIGYTLIDSVTIELDSPAKRTYSKAILEVENSDKYLIVREWINSTRCIVSEIPNALAENLNVESASLDDLTNNGTVTFSMGPIVDPQEWVVFMVNNTGGHLRWLEQEQLYLELYVHDYPSEVNGSPVVADFVEGLSPEVNSSLIRQSGIYDRLLEEQSPISMQAIHEGTPFDVSVGKSIGKPLSNLDILPYELVQTLRTSNKPAISRDPLGLTLNQNSFSDADSITEQVGLVNEVNLSDATFASTDPTYPDGIDEFLFNNFEIKEGDVRYPYMRKLTLMYASGIIGTANFDPSKLTLTSSSGIFKDEHIGLTLFLSSANTVSVFVAITGIINSSKCEVSYISKYREIDSGTPIYEVSMTLAPRKEVIPSRGGESLPALTVEGISVVGGRVSDSPAILLDGHRTIESSYSVGDILRPLLGFNNMTMAVTVSNNQHYLNFYFSPTHDGVSYADLPDAIKLNENEGIGSLAGYIYQGSIDLDSGYPELQSAEQGNSSLNHRIPRIYEITQTFGFGAKQHKNILVDSNDVILYVDINNPNLVLGMKIPVPSFVTTTTLNQSVMLVGGIYVRGCQLSLNKDISAVEDLVSHNAEILNKLIVPSAAYQNAKTEITSTGIKYDGVVRPELAAETDVSSRIVTGAVSTHASLNVKHDYPILLVPDSLTDISAELSIGDGRGQGVAARIDSDFRPDENNSQAPNVEASITVSNSQYAASVQAGGMFATSPLSRAEDINDSDNLTGFDHRELYGDLSVSQQKITDLSNQLDEMKQREFNMLKQLSYHAAMLHETSDMLRTAKACIKTLRNVQYELIMTITAMADYGEAAGGQGTIRNKLEFLSLADGNYGTKDVNKDVFSRLYRAAHYAGHLSDTGFIAPSELIADLGSSDIDYNDLYGNAPNGTYSYVFSGTNAINSNPGALNPDEIPLRYRKPGYYKLRYNPGLNAIDEHEDFGSSAELDNLIGDENSHSLYSKRYTSNRDNLLVSVENISWGDAETQFNLLNNNATNEVILNFRGDVSRLSPLFSLKPRSRVNGGEQFINNFIYASVMGTGYWSVIGTSGVSKVKTDTSKALPSTAGWSFINSSNRLVGPNQVAIHSNPFITIYDSYRNTVLGSDVLGSNANMYTDAFILNKVDIERDIVFGVRTSVSGQTGSWTVSKANTLGYTDYYQYNNVVIPSDVVEEYDNHVTARQGTALFYTVAEDHKPKRIIPGLYHSNDQLSTTVNIKFPGGYEHGVLPLDIPVSNSGQPDEQEDKPIVYFRAWCVVRRSTRTFAEDMLLQLGFTENDPRVNIIERDNEFVAIRTKLGMSDLLRQYYGNYAGSGQINFSFREYNNGRYAKTDKTVTDSKDF